MSKVAKQRLLMRTPRRRCRRPPRGMSKVAKQRLLMRLKPRAWPGHLVARCSGRLEKLAASESKRGVTRCNQRFRFGPSAACFAGWARQKCAAAAGPHAKDVKRRLSLPKTRCRSLAPPPKLGACAPLQASRHHSAGLALRPGPDGCWPRHRPLPIRCARCGRAGCMRLRAWPAWPLMHRRRRPSVRQALRRRHWAGCGDSFSSYRCTTCRSTTASSQNSRSLCCAAAKAAARRATGPNSLSLWRWHRRTLLTPTTRCWPTPATEARAQAEAGLSATSAGRFAVRRNQPAPTLRQPRFTGPLHAEFDSEWGFNVTSR